MKILLSIILFASISKSCVIEEYGYFYKLGSNKVNSQVVTQAELTYIYSGKIRNWEDGQRIKIFVRPYSDFEQKGMVINVLGISMSAFKENVNKNRHIRMVKTNMLFNKLVEHPGSIGIISEDEIYISTQMGLVLVKVEE